jgi:glycosyltransferase involved in cell wall biosynthesis
MRILMLSWEFPPKVVGGLARHVEELSAALVRAGHDIYVVTDDDSKSSEFEIFKDIKVYRVKSYRPKHLSFIDQIMHLNFGLLEHSIDLLRSEKFDLVHAHDWLVAHAGITLKRAFGTPLVVTMHATEHGRWNGIHNDLQNYIHSMEWLLNYESIGTIVCSYFMENEMYKLFNLPKNKVFVLPNGIERDKFNFDFDQWAFRRQFVPDNYKLVMSVGRMVPEKGFQVLINSAPKVLYQYPNVRFVIAGKGGMLDSFRNQVEQMGLSDRVWFLGYVSDEDLNKLFIVSDAAVFPSLYEPFGITAIESMAAGTPVIVSDTGGLGEIVEHGYTGIKTYAGNPDSLAWGILQILQNEDYANYLRQNAYNKVVSVFNWDIIAKNTTNVYNYLLS